MIEFTVRGNPKALKRHRTGVIYRKGPDGKPIPVKTKDGRVMTHEYDPSAEDKKDFLAVVERNVPPVILEGPLCLEVFMYFLRPKNHYGSGRNEGILKESAPEWHFGKPDADNVVKFIKDALNTKYYRDDGQVSILFAIKRFAKNYPYIHVRIKTVDEFMESVDHRPKNYVDQQIKQLSLL